MTKHKKKQKLHQSSDKTMVLEVWHRLSRAHRECRCKCMSPQWVGWLEFNGTLPQWVTSI